MTRDDCYADETCDKDCRVVGRDGKHRCLDAIIRANPDGMGPERMGFYLGVSKQGVEYTLRNIMARHRLVRGLAPIHRDHIAA